MRNYLDLLSDILTNGTTCSNRTGIDTKCVYGRTLKYNLSNSFPILTTRKVSLKIAFEECMFFLRGETQTKLLESVNVNVWKENTSRQFLDSVGLTNLQEGDMGKGYGYQMRNFGGTGYDQFVHVLNGLQQNPSDRRHVITHWCPHQLSEAALPPCHVMHMYSVTNGQLNSSFIMRSSDAYLGLPTNIMGYALYNIIFAKYLKLVPGELTYFGHDVHIYANHIDNVKLQLERNPLPQPQLEITKQLDCIQDILDLNYTDLQLVNYTTHKALPKVKMAV